MRSLLIPVRQWWVLAGCVVLALWIGAAYFSYAHLAIPAFGPVEQADVARQRFLQHHALWMALFSVVWVVGWYVMGRFIAAHRRPPGRRMRRPIARRTG